jgi:hypothetical protein
MTKQHDYQVSLRVVHPAMSPSVVTQRLKLAPSASWKKGEPRRTPKGRDIGGVRESSYWCARLRVRPAGDIATVVASALERFEKHRAFFRKAVASGGRVSLYVTGRGGGLAEVFELSLLSRLVRMSCVLELEVFERL